VSYRRSEVLSQNPKSVQTAENVLPQPGGPITAKKQFNISHFKNVTFLDFRKNRSCSTRGHKFKVTEKQLTLSSSVLRL
jgi:hypothetical protein